MASCSAVPVSQVADELKKAPGFLQPLVGALAQWIPKLESPSSKTGVVLLVVGAYHLYYIVAKKEGRKLVRDLL